MTNEAHTTLRFPGSVAARIDALLADVEADPSLLGVRISRSFVTRRALVVGLEKLERRYREGGDVQPRVQPCEAVLKTNNSPSRAESASSLPAVPTAPGENQKRESAPNPWPPLGGFADQQEHDKARPKSPRFHLSPTEHLVLELYRGHADRKTGEAWPSVRVLAEELDCSESAVKKARSKLTRLGFLALLERHAQGKRNARYRVLPLVWQGDCGASKTSAPGGTLLTLSDAARRAGVSRQALTRRVQRGTVDSVRVEVGGQLQVRVPLEALLALYPDAGPAPPSEGKVGLRARWTAWADNLELEEGQRITPQEFLVRWRDAK